MSGSDYDSQDDGERISRQNMPCDCPECDLAKEETNPYLARARVLAYLGDEEYALAIEEDKLAFAEKFCAEYSVDKADIRIDTFDCGDGKLTFIVCFPEFEVNYYTWLDTYVVVSIDGNEITTVDPEYSDSKLAKYVIKQYVEIANLKRQLAAK